MNCRIEWSEFSSQDWDAYLQKVQRANLLQSYDYGAAMARHHKQALRTGLIMMDENPAGVFLALEAHFFGGLLRSIFIDRAPLWFEGFGALDHLDGFIKTLRREFPRRPGRRLRFIPEVEDSAAVQEILRRNNFRKNADTAYATIWLDLRQDEKTLRAGLDKKWRNRLVKAEKNNLSIEWDESGVHFPWLMQVYAADKNEKGYSGPSVKTMQILHRRFMAKRGVLLGRALKNGEPAGAILLFCHGRSATYQIGWSGQIGRDLGAHYLLLWEAVLLLKAGNTTSFDLGGINDEMAHGVAKFKNGMGGRLTDFPGAFF